MGIFDLSPEDEARLKAEGKQLLGLLGNAIVPALMAVATGNFGALLAALVPVLGQASSIATPADARLALVIMWRLMLWAHAHANEAVVLLSGLEEGGPATGILLDQLPPPADAL